MSDNVITLEDRTADDRESDLSVEQVAWLDGTKPGSARSVRLSSRDISIEYTVDRRGTPMLLPGSGSLPA